MCVILATVSCSCSIKYGAFDGIHPSFLLFNLLYLLAFPLSRVLTACDHHVCILSDYVSWLMITHLDELTDLNSPQGPVGAKHNVDSTCVQWMVAFVTCNALVTYLMSKT